MFGDQPRHPSLGSNKSTQASSLSDSRGMLETKRKPVIFGKNCQRQTQIESLFSWCSFPSQKTMFYPTLSPLQSCSIAAYLKHDGATGNLLPAPINKLHLGPPWSTREVRFDPQTIAWHKVYRTWSLHDSNNGWSLPKMGSLPHCERVRRRLQRS